MVVDRRIKEFGFRLGVVAGVCRQEVAVQSATVTELGSYQVQCVFPPATYPSPKSSHVARTRRELTCICRPLLTASRSSYLSKPATGTGDITRALSAALPYLSNIITPSHKLS